MAIPATVRSSANEAQRHHPPVELLKGATLVVHQRRPLSPELVSCFERCARGEAFDVVAPLTAAEPLSTLPGVLREEAAREQLVADLRRLVPQFLEATGNTRLFARLKVIDHDGCRRFHRDFIKLRALVTYSGPGTEWLSEDNLRRAHLDDEGDVDEVNRRIVVDWPRVRRADAGDVLWLKGVEYRGSSGAVHRSPAVQGTGIRRVVLKLDDQAIPSA